MKNIAYFINNNKNKLYIIVILFIVLLLLIIVNNKANVSDKKIFKVPNIIIEKTEKDNNIPFININTPDIAIINSKILEIYNNTILTNKNNKFTYKSNIHNNILYLIIISTNYNEDKTYYNKSFSSYYVDLETKKILTNEDILNRNDKNYIDIGNNISNILLEKYNIEKENGYIISEDCDYTCYLNYHNLDDLKEKVVYYYDNKLEAYLNYTLETVYFNPDDYIAIPYKYSF